MARVARVARASCVIFMAAYLRESLPNMLGRPSTSSKRRSRGLRRLCFWCVLLLICGPIIETAWAHPMGNFSVGHYTAIRVEGGFIQCRYRIDLAEVPSMEQMSRLDPEGTGSITDARKKAWFDRELPKLTAGQKLTINGEAKPLEALAFGLQTRPGASDLPTILLSIDCRAPIPAGARRIVVEYADTNYPQRRGWREIVVESGAGARVVESTASDHDRTDGLETYPADLSAVPDMRAARVVFDLAGSTGIARVREGDETIANAATPIRSASPPGIEPVSVGRAKPPVATTRIGSASSTAADRAPVAWVAVSLAMAFALGSLRAVGGRSGETPASVRGVLSAAAKSAAKDVAVALGLALMMAAIAKLSADDRIPAWAAFALSVSIATVAAAQALRRHAAARGLASNVPSTPREPGLLPCPAAFLVLLIGLALGKPALGILLIAVFGASLGASAAAIGLVGFRARALSTRSGVRTILPRRRSILAPALIAVLGIVVGLRSLMMGGVLRIHLVADARPAVSSQGR